MKKQLGEILVEREWLTREQLHQALKHQQVFGGRLGTCLLELALLTEDRLGKALAEQLGAPLASADDLRIIAEDVLELIPAKLACRAKVVPFERYGNSVSVAMLETGDLMLQDELGFVVSKRLRVHVATEIRVLEALEKHYHCGVEQRFGRIWDRLNRSRFLWQDEGTGAGGPVRRPVHQAASPKGPASPPTWQPAPPPPLESGISRLSAAGVAASAATRPSAGATTQVLPPPPLPPLLPLPPPDTAAGAPVPAPLRAATPPGAAVETAMPPPPPPRPPAPPAAAPAPPPRPATVPSAPPGAAATPPPAAATPPPAAATPPPPAAAAEPTSGPVAAARRTVRDDEATSPLVLPQPTGTLEELRRRLEDVEDRDDVAHAALSFLERRVPRRLLFMVRGAEVSAWMGSGEGVDQRVLSELSFGFDEPSLFLNLREGSPFYRGPLARLDAHQRLVKAWGGKYPRECLVLPVRVQKRLVAVVYCDRGTEGLSGVDMEQLQEMAAALGHALESFLRKKKLAK